MDSKDETLRLVRIALIVTLIAVGAGSARTAGSGPESDPGVLLGHGVQRLHDGVLAGLGPAFEVRFHERGIE